MKVDHSLQMVFEELGLAKHEATRSSEEEFAALVERRSRFVFKVAYSVLRDRHYAEDVVQETFLRVYRNRKRDVIEDEQAFLARIAWRLAVDRLPKVRTEPPDLERLSTGETPETTLLRLDRETIVQRLIDNLPEELKLPLVLSTVEELTSSRIGEILGVPESTVRTRLLRARNLLKQKLAAILEGRHGR